MVGKHGLAVGVAVTAAVVVGSASPASAAKPTTSTTSWFSSGFDFSCTTSSGTVLSGLDEAAEWTATVTDYFDAAGALTRERSRETGSGELDNETNGKSVRWTTTRVSTTTVATGVTAVNSRTSYYRDGALVRKEAGRLVFDTAGNILSEVGKARRTTQCDLVA